jgi:hypothetical protein
MEDVLDAACKLNRLLLNEHWTGQLLVGPDPGVRINARIGRFVKSYLHNIPWHDEMAYLQAQGYWMLDQWLLADRFGDASFGLTAIACAEAVLQLQHSAGYWDYPNREWRGRVATVEGCWASLGLLECYARTGRKPFLTGAEQWHKYLIETIGFRQQRDPRMLAVNYFSHHDGDGGGVPNNAALALRFMARLAELARQDRYLAHGPALIAWLSHVQFETGELPYRLGSNAASDRPHFLCYQYNAFEFMDLVHYYKITGDRTVWAVLERLAGYLAGGLNANGAARFDCTRPTPEVAYYTSAIARALSQAATMGLGNAGTLADLGFQHVLSLQRPDGGFEFHSRADYGLLTDRRLYPRYLTMILNHLLWESEIRAIGSRE